MRRSDSRGRVSGNEAAIRLWFCEVEGHELISRCPFNKDLDERMKGEGLDWVGNSKNRPAMLERGRIKRNIEYYLVGEKICLEIAVFVMRNSWMHFIFQIHLLELK